jgi:predicted oxidoreductase
MQKVNLGTSPLQVSRLAYGAWRLTEDTGRKAPGRLDGLHVDRGHLEAAGGEIHGAMLREPKAARAIRPHHEVRRIQDW